MGLTEKLDAAQSHFLNPELFSESIKFWPGGDNQSSDALTFYGIWDDDALEGKNQIEGEGSNLEGRGGRRIRHTVYIEAPVSLAVNERRDPPDVFKRVATGDVVQLKRIASQDGQMQSLECVRTTAEASRYPARRG